LAGGIPRPVEACSLRQNRGSGVSLRIKARKEALAPGLPGDALEGHVIVRRCATDTPRGDATITVAEEHTAFVIDRDFIKVEQVAIGLAAALLPDAGMVLHRIVWGSIDCHPGLTLIVGGRDKSIPLARET